MPVNLEVTPTEAMSILEKGAHLHWLLQPKVAETIEKFVKSMKLPAVPAEQLHATVFDSFIPGFRITKKQVYEIASPKSIFVTVRGSKTRPCVINFELPQMERRFKELYDIETRVANKQGWQLKVRYSLSPHIKILEYADPMKVNAQTIEHMTEFFRRVPLLFTEEYIDTRDISAGQLPTKIDKPRELTPEENKARIRNSQLSQEYRDRKK